MKTIVSICVFAVHLVLGTGLAQAQSTESALPPLLVTINEKTTSDTQRATLVKAIAAEVPSDQWKTVTVREGDSLTSLINKYYGIYSTKNRSNPYSQPLPETTQSVVQLIRDANNLPGDAITAGKPLRMPPIPVRPRNGDAVPDVVRAFSPKTQSAYALAGAAGVKGFAAPTSSPLRTKDQLQTVRGARATFVALSSDNPMLSDALVASDAASPPLINNVDLATVPVRLLRTDALCAESASVLTKSPYLAAAKARVANALPVIQAAIKNRHLTLIDFDFKADHGAWVQSVAGLILKTFGALSLANDGGIRRSELNPGVARAELDEALTDYFTNAGLDSQSAAVAALWVLTAPNEVGQAIHKVNVAILQAVLWRALSRGDVVSLSWQVDNTTGIKTLQREELLRTKGSAIVVAAGNDEGQEIGDRFPQSEALSQPAFVNVTYGSIAGEPFGSITGTKVGGRVDVLATGCGLDASPVTPAYYGSSLAAPIVATSAWLRMLLDTATSSTAIRAEVMKASLLVPPQPKAITISGGVFDPARLIANPGPHYLDPQRQNMTAVTALDLDAGACGRLTLSVGGASIADAIVYKESAKYFLLKRQQLSGFAGAQVGPPCELSTLTGSLTTATGPITITDPASFVSRIGHLTY